MTQNGKVVSADGGFAVVRVIRQSACDGCKQKNLCSGMSPGCSEGKTLDVTAKNTAGAKAGDEVLLSSSSTFILETAFCIFILPLIAAFAAYFACAALNTGTSFSYAASAAIFLLTAGGFCFGINYRAKKKTYVEIVKILKEE